MISSSKKLASFRTPRGALLQDVERVLILYEGTDAGGDFGRSFANGFRANGCEVELLGRQETWQKHFDLVLAYGPFQQSGSMLPVARRLLALPSAERPLFVWWLTEGVPALQLPKWSVKPAGHVRLLMDRWSGSNGLARYWMRGHRLRIIGELQWLRSHGILDVLAVTSFSRAAYLQGLGFRPIVVPLGYDPDYYGFDMGLPRDIDVCFLGDLHAVRRRRLVERVAKELERSGIHIALLERLYGEERTRFLNRTKIMLNILRAPQDFVGQRFLLGAANKTLVVSEPIDDHRPYEPGRQHVVAPVEKLAQTIAYYLSHESERRKIVEEAYRFVTQELTITRMVDLILQRARLLRSTSASTPVPGNDY